MLGMGKVDQKSQFLTNALNESFEPQQQTLKNIMSFANAYRNEKTKSMGNVEMMMN
jgi:hypothetical protein